MMITDQMIQLRRELLCLQELRLLVGEAGVLIGRGTLSIETKKKKREIQNPNTFLHQRSPATIEDKEAFGGEGALPGRIRRTSLSTAPAAFTD